ncbi:asparaginase domain-containing protein [Sarocladium implicatum]|nr:asparaginase domain-containing protein [Sarocladium implicatum]
MAEVTYGTDGALERMLRLGHKMKQVPAIFIHAGAGFHSHQNEHVHLKACVAAAKMGMRFLKAGASATEAVEAALRVLEDKEITNAGYGSNLSIDGTVECDATIVDHLGRSGACGATPTKLILDLSNQPLSLRRVPPNALVGEGARTFAEENGMATFPNEYLVSKNARDRFLRWQDDLQHAEAKIKKAKGGHSAGRSETNEDDPCRYDAIPTPDPTRTFPRDNAAAVMSGTWNEGQPDSPYPGTPAAETGSVTDSSSAPSYFRSGTSALTPSNRGAVRATVEQAVPGTMSLSPDKQSPSARLRAHARPTAFATSSLSKHMAAGAHESRSRSGASQNGNRDGADSPQIPAANSESTSDFDGRQSKRLRLSDSLGLPTADQSKHPSSHLDGDHITDTVGAIAIDSKGHIAAASSSGGIGMKHRGRLGPAALVGIGTAVVPCAPDDEDGVTVAAVTSGTGEHMATTMASQRCAERIYHGTRKGPDGLDIKDDDEDAVLESFVVNDFMGHPGVKHCPSAGAIGVMVVKKTRSGYYFSFAHNTDSFALASMGGGEIQATCVMSRMPKGYKIAKGARKIRLG